MAKKPTRTSKLLMTESAQAKKFWGKEVEDALPKPTILELSELTAAHFLLDILQFARGAESRGEWLFRKNYLHPLFNHFAEQEGTEWREDDMGNMYVTVGESPILHVGHIDTVHSDDHSPLQEINIKGDIISLAPVKKNSAPKNATGVRWVNDVDVKYHYTQYVLPETKTRSLGADDGCAVAVMLLLIANQIPGTYVFTRGEEIGCVGTHHIIENNLLDWSKYSAAIEIDRKGTTEILCSMGVGTTASQSFGKSLAKALGMNHNTTGKGSVTDIAHMAKFIPECVNVAAGYLLQHSDRETTNFAYLNKLGASMIAADWSSLVIERKPGEFTSARPKHKTNNQSGGWTGDYLGSGHSGYYGSGSSKNSYGDFQEEPFESKAQYQDLFKGMTEWQQEAYVRSNAGFIVELLLSLNVSPAELHNLICYGDLEGEVEDATVATNVVQLDTKE